MQRGWVIEKRMDAEESRTAENEDHEMKIKMLIRTVQWQRQLEAKCEDLSLQEESESLLCAWKLQRK